MYYNEQLHQDLPHFHARYSGRWASFGLEPFKLLAGELPPRASALISEWAEGHKVELMANWIRAQNHEPLAAVAPLS